MKDCALSRPSPGQVMQGMCLRLSVALVATGLLVLCPAPVRAAGVDLPDGLGEVTMVIHYDTGSISSDDADGEAGALSMVERRYERLGTSVTTLAFRSASGVLVEHHLNGITGEVRSVFRDGSLSLMPVGDGGWWVSVESPGRSVRAGLVADAQALVEDPELLGAMARVVDREALLMQIRTMEAQLGVDVTSLGPSPDGFWDCAGSVSWALLAGAGMAATCVATPYNPYLCAGAVAGYGAALNQVAEDCLISSW